MPLTEEKKKERSLFRKRVKSFSKKYLRSKKRESIPTFIKAKEQEFINHNEGIKSVVFDDSVLRFFKDYLYRDRDGLNRDYPYDVFLVEDLMKTWDIAIYLSSIK